MDDYRTACAVNKSFLTLYFFKKVYRILGFSVIIKCFTLYNIWQIFCKPSEFYFFYLLPCISLLKRQLVINKSEPTMVVQ